MTQVAKWKTERVKVLADSISSSRVVGIVNITNIPALQMLQMRRGLRGKAKELTVSKNSLLTRALQKASEGNKVLADLIAEIEGQTALVLSDENPFKLYKNMSKTQTRAPAKGGEVAPEDISVSAGETPFKPGPIVGELQKVGIPAAIEQGKVVIKKDKVLVKAGEKIPRETAQMLTRLDILPLTVGLDLRAAYEDGVIYKKDVLAVDEEQMFGNIASAHMNGISLALEIGYATKVTIEPLLMRAKMRAMNLSLESGFPTKDSIELLLTKAQSQMLTIASEAPDAQDDELKDMISSGASRGPDPDAGGDSQKESSEKEETKEEKVSEDEAAAGLGALFG